MENTDHQDAKFVEVFNIGITLLKKFSANNDKINDLNLLHNATKKFMEALEIKKNRPEPYFYLAYTFYLLNELSFAMTYMRVVAFLEPAFPGLKYLRENLAHACINKHI